MPGIASSGVSAGQWCAPPRNQTETRQQQEREKHDLAQTAQSLLVSCVAFRSATWGAGGVSDPLLLPCFPADPPAEFPRWYPADHQPRQHLFQSGRVSTAFKVVVFPPSTSVFDHGGQGSCGPDAVKRRGVGMAGRASACNAACRSLSRGILSIERERVGCRGCRKGGGECGAKGSLSER
eukprot:935734-Rhodomonas_salina.1